MTPEFAAQVTFRLKRVTIAGLFLALTSSPAAAQTPATDAESRGQLGPLGVSPSISWQTEYDNNVFRSGPLPVADVISTLGGKTEARSRFGHLGVTANGSADWVHYSRLESERGLNAGGSLRADLLFNRIAPYVTASYANTRERLNPEIDNRPRMIRSTLGAGGMAHFGVKTSLDFSMRREETAYDENTTANGVVLSEALNRITDRYAVSLLQEINTLTRLNITGELQRHQYDTSTFRNADNLRLTAGFESDGVIKGRARAGIQSLRPVGPGVDEVRGFFLSVGTTATVFDRLQIGVDAERDFPPSYRLNISYYETYSYGASVSYAMRRSLRLSAHAGRRVSDYQSYDELSTSPDRLGIDDEIRYGSGMSYLFGDSLSMNVAATYSQRTSPNLTRRFDGLSIRAGVTHEF